MVLALWQQMAQYTHFSIGVMDKLAAYTTCITYQGVSLGEFVHTSREADLSIFLAEKPETQPPSTPYGSNLYVNRLSGPSLNDSSASLLTSHSVSMSSSAQASSMLMTSSVSAKLSPCAM